MDSEKTLILIDGHALAFRQYYALERTNMKTTDGTPSWAVYGFFKSIFDLLKNKDLNPDAIAVAFDVSHQTFRVEKFPEYKSNRAAMPDPMKIQMDLIYEGLRAFNIPIYTKEGFEADDVIGTISKKACELGHKVLILTGDQDAFQLVDERGCVKVILPSKGELVEYNWDKIYEKLGVYPNQVIDYKALRGDTSDCIPGIKGIGEKTACKLLEKFKNLDNILSCYDEITEKAVKEKIKNGVEIAKLSQYLATIVRDLDIDFDFSKANIELPDVTAVSEFLTKLQFYSFLRNINAILTSFNREVKPAETTKKVETASSADGMQLGLFGDTVRTELNKFEIKYDKKEILNQEDLAQMVEELSKSEVFAIKTIGEVKSPVDVNLRGIAFAYNKKIAYRDGLSFDDKKEFKTQSYFVPLDGQGKLTKEAVWAKLKPILEDEKIKKVTYDLKNEYNILRLSEIDFKGFVFDVMLASYIKEPARNHELNVQAIERINHIMAEYAPFEANKKKRIGIMDASENGVYSYAADLVATIVELTEYWHKQLDEKELNLLNVIEIPLSCVLADMEYVGVSVDVEYLKKLSESMENSSHKLERKIYDIAGEGFNLNSPRQVGEVLFDKLQIPNPKKRKNKKYSTSAEILEELAENYEIAELILQYRKYAKLKSTYTDALPQLISQYDGRIHTTFNQTITATGRLSSSNPNLQNIPVRTEEGNKIRNAFVPKDIENYLIMSADYSQIELRLLAHISGDKHLIEAFRSGVDVHTLTASKVFDVPVEDVTKEMRYKSKAVNFGIIYGQSKYGLAKALDISWEEAEDFINKYFKTYPGVKKYMNEIVKLAEKQGYVESIYGRKRHLESELFSSNMQLREFGKRAAINHPMQGTAADLIKIAMIELNKKLKENNLESKMILQVHDELVLEVKKSEFEKVKSLVLESMELGQPFEVPLLVDVSAGGSWKE